MHPYAVPAAIAARAAHLQGKFWEMQAALLTEPVDLRPEGINRAAVRVGLSLPRFRKDTADPERQAEVEGEKALASQLGIYAVPAFFLNGRYLPGARPYEEFHNIVQEELDRARAIVAKGVPRSQVYEASRRASQTGL